MIGSNVLTRRYGGWLIAALVAALIGMVLTAAPKADAATGPTYFDEDFASNTLGPNLTLRQGNANTSAGNVVFPGSNGNIVATNDTNYHTENFCAEVTVVSHNGNPRDNRVYLGLGNGLRANFGDTDYPLIGQAVLLRHITNWANNDINNLTVAVAPTNGSNSGATELTNQSNAGPGKGPYTLQMQHADGLVTFLVNDAQFWNPIDVSSYTFASGGRVFVAGLNTTVDDLSVSPGPCGAADSDGDGVPDDQDAFPNDPTETTDTDGDGVGDNGDAFPNDPTETTDSDGDGVGDNGDAFPMSNTDPNVVIGDCDSGVANQMLGNGASFNDLLGEAAASASNHGKYVKAVSQLSSQWKKDGLISGKDKGRITSCAARSDIP